MIRSWKSMADPHDISAAGEKFIKLKATKYQHVSYRWSKKYARVWVEYDFNKIVTFSTNWLLWSVSTIFGYVRSYGVTKYELLKYWSLNRLFCSIFDLFPQTWTCLLLCPPIVIRVRFVLGHFVQCQTAFNKLIFNPRSLQNYLVCQGFGIRSRQTIPAKVTGSIDNGWNVEYCNQLIVSDVCVLSGSCIHARKFLYNQFSLVTKTL